MQGISRSLIGQSRSHKVFQFPYDFEDYFLMINLMIFHSPANNLNPYVSLFFKTERSYERSTNHSKVCFLFVCFVLFLFICLFLFSGLEQKGNPS